MRSVYWCCWLGGRKGIRPVEIWSEVQTCIWPNWCYCHSLSLAPIKSRLVLPFWYRLTRVVPDKWPLNGCVLQILHPAKETVQITLFRRTPASSPKSECASCCQQKHVGSKTLHQQNPPVLNWRCQLMQVDLYYNNHKTEVVMTVIIDSTNYN